MPKGYPNKVQDSDNFPIRAQEFDSATLAAGGPDVLVAPPNVDVKELLADEAFLNQKIKIRCKATGNNNEPKAVELGIDTGGITGPMGPPTPENPFGTPGVAGRGGKRVVYAFRYNETYDVPRYVFEALANARTTTLRQRQHPSDPMQMIQVNEHTHSYNFECVHDPAGAKGEAWREWILRRAA